eukprot:jgi/Mesvir1/6852/Mv25044-RA.2
MCGILAALGLNGDATEVRSRLLRLSKRLRHRGPDWSSLYAKDNVYMAHERLSIVDPGSSGDQPLFNKDRSVCWIVNGEIYNHEKLQGQFFLKEKVSSRSDSECVGHLYEEFGDKFVPMLDGMFAFVLSDSNTGTVVAGRDQMGICPLYIGYAGESVWFASEAKALIDDCERIEIFKPGHVFVGKVTPKGCTGEIKRWYNPIWVTNLSYIPSNPVDYGLLRTTFIKAVVKCLMSDVPAGILLSGGLDSSLVTSIAVRHGVESTNMYRWAPRVHTFSIGIKGAPDLIAARKVATHCDTVHHEFHFTVQEALDSLYDLIWHLESFEQVRASVPMYLMSRKIKAMGVKMVISGEGADEIFGGYLYFHKAPSAEEFHRECVRKVTRLHQWDVMRANKSTQAWGVEARVPFLDKAVLDVAMNINPKEKVIDMKELPDGKHPKMEKYILRKAFDDPVKPYLPEDVLWRQKEQFSDGVGYDWVDGLKAYAENVVTDAMFKERTKRFPVSTPESKEYYLLRSIFEQHFPHPDILKTIPWGKSIACSTPEAAMTWDKEWALTTGDISGRAIKNVHVAGKDFQLPSLEQGSGMEKWIPPVASSEDTPPPPKRNRK